jgi:zinc protease
MFNPGGSMHKLIFSAVFISIIISTTVFAQINLDVERTVLDNGLTVLTYEDHSFPTVSYQTFVNAGSRDELRPGATGIAHVFEHMMFRGTPTHPDFDDAVAYMGPQTNAYTGQDYTCYFINARAEFLPEIIAIEADRVRNLRFTNETFRRELGPVKEERRRFCADDPDGFMEEQIYKLAYTRHTYEHPVIGWEQDLEKNMTFRDADDFRSVFYSPNYVTIVIAGNFNTESILDIIQQHYGDWPSSLPPIGRIRKEPAQKKERVKTYDWKSAEVPGKLAIAYHGPDLNFYDNDLLALQVLSRVLFSNSGRLSLILKDEQRLVESIRAQMEGKKDPGLFLINTNLTEPIYKDSVLQLIYSEFDKVKKEGVSQDELSRVVNSMKAEFVYRLNRPSRIVGTIGYYHHAGGDYKMMFKYYDKLGTVTNDNIMNAAKKYLQKKNRNVVYLNPKDAG